MSTSRIAVVGLACRYPDASTPQQLWQTVLHRRVAFRRLPPQRLSGDYMSDDDGDPDRTYVRRAAVLTGWEFDRGRFRVPGPLYRAVDLTHWLALEVADEVLHDAGHPGGEGLERDRVGVVLGNSLGGEFSRAAQLRLRWPFVRRVLLEELTAAGLEDQAQGPLLEAIEQRFKAPFPVPADETLAGGLSNTIAGRICNVFGFRGTGHTVDGACASSLLAIASACDALIRGDLDLAIAGGVDLSLDPFELVGFARMGALSHGPMRVYDARPTGFLPGEGCGMVALMRANDAERRGARVYAHVLGTGTSTDGAGGLTRPEQRGQLLAAQRAYQHAGVEPSGVTLVEGHGTGTRVGDEVELRALSELRAGAPVPAALGSIKANIGHTKAAAGVAGLIKAAQALHHRVLPPTTGCATPHPLLRDSGALRVLARPEPWEGRALLAGVASSGFGGINAHVVLAGAERPRGGWGSPAIPPTGGTRAQVAVLTAADAGDAVAGLQRLARVADGLSDAELLDCAAALAGAADLSQPLRIALVAHTPALLARRCEQALELLGDVAAAGRAPVRGRAGVYVGRGLPGRVGLLFPGQAAPVRHDAGALGALLSSAGRRLSAGLQSAVPRPSSPAGGEPVDTAWAQPAILASSLTALRWLDELGVLATAALGHSLGELSALAWAGVLEPADAVELAAARGRLMSRHGRTGGGMTSVRADSAAAAELLEGTEVVVAGINGAGQTVVAGPIDQLARVERRAAGRALGTRRLAVSHAFHSPAMRPALAPFAAALSTTPTRPPRGTVVSTVTGDVLSSDEDLAALLTRQLTAPVRFAEALERLAARCDLLVEVGTGRILSDLAAEATAVPVVATDLDDGGDGLAETLAALAAAGAVTSVAPWFAGRFVRAFDVERPRSVLVSPCETGAGGGEQAAPSPPPVTLARPPAPVPAIPAGDPLRTVRALLAASLELDEALVTPDQGLLRDLHLNSLRVVQLVGQAADALGRARPASPLGLADATVADVAEVLEALPRAGEDEHGPPPGAGSWTRPFRDDWEPVREVPAPGAAAAHSWQVHQVGSGELPWRPPSGGPALPQALLLVLHDGADRDLHGLASACRTATGARDRLARVVVLSSDGSGTAVARSLCAELDVPVAAVQVPQESAAWEAAVALVCTRAEPFLDLRVTAGGAAARRVSVLTPLFPLGEGVLPLAPGDVCLVTGGVAGITAHCAQALAARTGCVLVVLGRRPADDPAVAPALLRLASQVTLRYVQADVSDPAAAAAAVAAARGHGPVTAILHGAGVNIPGRIGDVTAETLQRALAPKVAGLANLLAAADEVRLIVGFASIIGRMGLAGQADYCIANDWMRLLLERVAAERPHCRVRALEWSLWSGVGMGVRMGVVDDLARRGVAAIGQDEGVDLFLRAVGDDRAPVTLLLSGRYPPTPTLEPAISTPPVLRFLQRQRVSHPGVEAVAEAEVSPHTDPYLRDHRIDGLPVLPAVVSLEALAQAATMADPGRTWRAFRDVELPAPVVVDDDATRTLRVAALIDPASPPRARAVLRVDDDRYATDRARATVLPVGTPSAPGPEPATPPPAAPHPFYGPLLFHTGVFRRLRAYEALSAYRCQAVIRSDPGPWFAPLLPQELLLGDPGAHDACIHVLQACMPHRRLLPVRVESLTVWRRPAGDLRVRAVETRQEGREHRYDVDVADARGEPVAEWRGLWLRAVQPLASTPLPLPLVGPRLARRRAELGVAGLVDLSSEPGPGGEVAGLLSRLTGEHVAVTRTPEGALRCGAGHASVSRCGLGTLGAHSPSHRVGVDWATAPPGDAWLRRLDPARRDLALAVRDKTGEDEEIAALRLWTTAEACVKAGVAADLALVIGEVSEQEVTLVSQGVTVLTSVAQVTDAGPVVAAVASVQP